MKTIFKIIVAYVRTDFDIKTYALVALFLFITIYFNYGLNWENGSFEDSILDGANKGLTRHFYYFLFYAFAYYGTFVLLSMGTKDWDIFFSKQFWIGSVFGLGVMAIDGSFSYTRDLTHFLFDGPDKYYLGKIMSNADSIVTVFMPLFLFYWFNRVKYDVAFFGLHNRNIKWKPYAVIVLIMSVLTFVVSFDKGFQDHYPVYDRYNVGTFENAIWYIWIFELVYGLDFISVELIFRGFFVIGMASLIGKKALLPMVTIYAFLHFGKPMNETVSSIFGGYALGVLAMVTRNIWGGVIVHMGTAWLMEIMAWLQHGIIQEE